MKTRGPNPTHYELFGVEPGCSLHELRSAYRRLALRYHPDVVAQAGLGSAEMATAQASMARINEAWRVLSDTGLRASYDEQVVGTGPLHLAREPVVTPQPSPQTRLSRRRAWAIGVQGQIARIARLAGRSATQALLIRQPRGSRADYEALVEVLVKGLIEDTESRVRAARAAGAAPLDLGVTATLVGIRTLADRLRREASLGVTLEAVMSAELLDRMWDILAHELPVQLTNALGGNPRAARALLDR